MNILEVLKLPPAERKTTYAVSDNKRKDAYGNYIDIGNVWIKLNTISGDYTDDFTDNDKFTGYGTYAFVWQKTLKETPERTDNGSMPQLFNLSYIITAHLKIDFDMLSIDDYRRIMRLLYSGNCFKVKTYDIDFDRMVIVEMYFSPEDLPTIYTVSERLQKNDTNEEWVDLLGVKNHTVEMVGTGNDNAQQRYFS